MSADGIMPELIKYDPFFAGMSSVIVTVNDIQAMGGVPAGVVNVISASRKTAELIIKGMKYAAVKFGIPILGGHYHPSDISPHLSIASVGFAKNLIPSASAKRGDDILMAIDLDGKFIDAGILALDAFSNKSKQEMRKIISLMPEFAKKNLINSAKDISNAGILGTIAIILELSRKGGIIDSELIPWDSRLPLKKWFTVYPSYGFILTTSPENTPAVIRTFTKHKITCNRIGVVIGGSELKVKWHGVYYTVANWRKRKIL
jgi:selenophosphate synthetase-related protein